MSLFHVFEVIDRRNLFQRECFRYAQNFQLRQADRWQLGDAGLREVSANRQ